MFCYGPCWEALTQPFRSPADAFRTLGAKIAEVVWTELIRHVVCVCFTSSFGDDDGKYLILLCKD